MAGKSTFLRQNALIAVLAQIGLASCRRERPISASSTACSAASAPPTISRAAARPSWSRWSRPPAILNQATERSLVILDEIGRGTATFDGLSIAWAAVEHLHEVNRCRALFATHYHELTALAGRLAAARQRHRCDVKEWQGEVVFLHEVQPGAADRSYGIQVAKLAGLPPPVVARARGGPGAAREGRRPARPPTALARRPAAVCGCHGRAAAPAAAGPRRVEQAARRRSSPTS